VTTVRPVRADAQRNRERLLSCAAEAFAEQGVAASLEDIARQADVGIGTLYRHFPTRHDLLEAVYRRQVTALCDTADELAASLPPGASLRAWLQEFAEYCATKRGLAIALKAAVGPQIPAFTSAHERIVGSVATLTARGVDAGVLRAGIDPLDLLRAVSGYYQLAEVPDAIDRGRQIVDVLMDGMTLR
jgi:AcrR family transcriptional regulator